MQNLSSQSTWERPLKSRMHSHDTVGDSVSVGVHHGAKDSYQKHWPASEAVGCAAKDRREDDLITAALGQLWLQQSWLTSSMTSSIRTHADHRVLKQLQPACCSSRS